MIDIDRHYVYFVSTMQTVAVSVAIGSSATFVLESTTQWRQK